MQITRHTPKRFWLTSLPLLMSLTACVSVGPDFQRPASGAPERFFNADSATAASPSLANWWRSLGDPVLEKLVDEALKNSLSQQNAIAKVEEARARRGLQSAQQGPSLNTSLDASRSSTRTDTSHSDSNKYGAGLDASWELDLFGGKRRALESAEAALAATQADLEASRVSLAAEVATNYLSLRSDEARLIVAQTSLASREKTLQLTKWRNEARIVSALEVNQAASSLEQARASVPSLQRSIEEDRIALAILLGRTRADIEALLPTTPSTASVPATLASGIPADTLRQRPDVRAAEYRYAAQTAQIGVAQAARYPAFKLSGSLGVEALTPAGLIRGDTITSSLLGSLTAPLFDAGRISQNIAIQNAVQTQTLLTYRSTVIQALADVEKALNANRRSQERLEILRNAASTASEAARLALIRYQTGQTDLLTVLDAQRTQLTQDDQLASAQGDRLAAVVQLYKALGGGWQATEETELEGKK